MYSGLFFYPDTGCLDQSALMQTLQNILLNYFHLSSNNRVVSVSWSQESFMVKNYLNSKPFLCRMEFFFWL